jgi:hypothetical protein
MVAGATVHAPAGGMATAVAGARVGGTVLGETGHPVEAPVRCAHGKPWVMAEPASSRRRCRGPHPAPAGPAVSRAQRGTFRS